MLKFLFGGRMLRIPYALFAVPILLLQAAMPMLFRHAPRFLEKTFGADLTTVGIYMTPLMVLALLLVLLLTIVSIKRLRDAGLTPWLALPILLRLIVGFAIGFYTTQAMSQAILDGTTVDPVITFVATWLPRVFFVYVYLLVLLLLILPTRSKSPVEASPATVF